MRVDALVNATAERGFILWRDGDNVRFRGNMEMPPEQINALRQQKLELLAYLKLREIAGEMDWQLSDLQDWYKNDLTDIASMDMDALRFVVKDYVHSIDICRWKGYQPPLDTPIENE